MDWRIKGLMQKALGRLPGGARIHAALQGLVGYHSHIEPQFESRLGDFEVMASTLAGAGRARLEGLLVEIGTGWYPMLPLCVHLTSGARVLTVDVEPLLHEEFTRRCLAFLRPRLDRLAAHGDRPRADIERRLDDLDGALRDGADLRRATGGAVEYRAPADARRLPLADGAADLVFSNNVLAHIPRDLLPPILREARRVLRPGGLMFHAINCGDQYAFADRSITRLNYLKYSEEAWTLWNNRFLYQNRLRARDYLALVREAGFEILASDGRAEPERLRELESIRVAPCFSGYTPEELCITSLGVVARRGEAP
jgi:SAM-dependent methyltransferase